MTAIIYDLRNATRIRVENVEQIQAMQTRMNGRVTNIWFMHVETGKHRSFPQRHYQIERIEK